MQDFIWWRDGVIYQIYPRSFMDSNADGLGDLPGVTSRLDYLSLLGIDAIWLSPFFPSPDRDFGYDISDHTTIDPRFGSMQDFDLLLQEAHRRGIRVILDLVLNHTSDQHPWFLESRLSRDNPRRDWYLWRDRPNNWRCRFGGSPWQLDPLTGQYYLHLFTPQQPDVNWRNPKLRQAQLDILRYWLQRGVDGFRLDVFNAYFKDTELRNNPFKIGLRAFDWQSHTHDIDQPEMLPLLKEFREITDGYSGTYLVGETFLPTQVKTTTYCSADRLHAVFSFELISAMTYLSKSPWNPHWLMTRIQEREKLFTTSDVWPTNVLSNHDLPRTASRYCRSTGDEQAFIAMTLLLTLRGTPFIYYGEELGMRDIQLTHNEILDPPGRRYWPFYKGRDACRSPMQWDASPNAGFSQHKSWLPVNHDYLLRNAASQQEDPHSLFHFTRRLLSLRKETPALARGDFLPLQSHRSVLSYMRKADNETVLVMMNFSGQKRVQNMPDGDWEVILSNSEGKAGKLAAYEAQVCVKR